MNAKVECKHICKNFQNLSLLDKLSFKVKNKEFMVLVGPNNNGKTTLLKIIAGLEKPTSGKVLVDGKEVQGPGPDRCMVFQNFALVPWKSVLDNVSFGLKFRNVPKLERYNIAKKYIDLVGLKGFENYYPHQLSGGMKQRVGIARAYASEADILLLDDPFGHLDAQTRYLMQNELLRIWETSRKTVIFVTNDIEEAVYLGDKVIVLSKAPGTHVIGQIEIDLPRPRDRMGKEFLENRQKVADLFEYKL